MIRLAGIPFRLHPLFFVVFMLAVWTGFFIELLTLFSIVLIHELGHIAAAKSWSWRISEIQLLPFGGVVKVEDEGNVPAYQELVVAAAGPLQHVWMIGLAFVFSHIGWWESAWATYFIQSNVMIGLFNLLPILPLDGGKILRALLCYLMPYYTVLRITLWSSLSLSMLLLITSIAMPGLGIQLNLFLISGFLCFANGYQLKHFYYTFLRYLIVRQSAVQERYSGKCGRGSAVLPIIASSQTLLQDIVKQFKKDRTHCIMIMQNGSVLETKSEKNVLELFLRTSR